MLEDHFMQGEIKPTLGQIEPPKTLKTGILKFYGFFKVSYVFFSMSGEFFLVKLSLPEVSFNPGKVRLSHQNELYVTA